MSQSRLEWKVGLFVVVCLTLLTVLVINFTKSSSPFSAKYELQLETGNIGGIIKGSDVRMAGVSIGKVRDIQLGRNATNGVLVKVALQIYERYQIYKSSEFIIESQGFLGDQYISVLSRGTDGPLLKDGDKVTSEEPFNLQEVARSAAGLLRRVDDTAALLNRAVARIDDTLLSEKALNDLTATFANFRTLSERSLGTMNELDTLIASNRTDIGVGVSNLVFFTEQLNGVAEELQATLATNRIEFTSAINNIEDSTDLVKGLLTNLEAGQGLAGKLLKDDTVAHDFSLAVSNLTVVSSNMARFGLLYKPKQPKSPLPKQAPYTGKSPFNK